MLHKNSWNRLTYYFYVQCNLHEFYCINKRDIINACNTMFLCFANLVIRDT